MGVEPVRMSSRTPRSCQAQGAPLGPGEWPRVCSGIPFSLLYLSRPLVSSLGLTGREVMPYECPKTSKSLSSSRLGCCCNGCCHAYVTQVLRAGGAADQQAHTHEVPVSTFSKR